MRIVLQALFLNVAINGGFVDVSPGKTLSLEEILQMSLKNVVSPNTTTPSLEIIELDKSFLPSALYQGTSQELPKVKFNHVNEGDYSIPEINKKSGVNKRNKHLFQGDILLTESVLDINQEINGSIGVIQSKIKNLTASRNKRQAVTNPYNLWTRRTVSFHFDSSVDWKIIRVFVKGAMLWQKNSCLNFVYNPLANDRIKVMKGQGCLAAIGKNGGEQLLSLGQGCDSVSIAAHEIGHALGLYHTMSRHDRDQFIIVDMANVEPYYRNQLLHHNYAQTFGLPYDYGSIMHYSGSSVSINKMHPAMMAFDLDHQQTLGSPFISFIDLSMINELYGCKQLCRPPTVACGMYGFPNPRDCRKCICPSGYGGDQCTERPKGNCGSTIGASPSWNILRVVMGDVNVRQPLEDFTICNYWIVSPPGTEIEIILLSFSNSFGVNGCVFDGVEIKTNKDQRTTGYRFCSNSAAWTRLRSHIRLVPVITWNRLYRSETRLLYRYVLKSEPRPTSRILQPFPTSTYLPSYFWTSGEATRRCVNHPSCAYLRLSYVSMFELCYGQTASSALIRIYCPSTCQCSTPIYGNIATGAHRPHINK